MARPQHPDGPWLSYNVRLRERDLQRVDAVCGGNRSEWTRRVVLDVLDVQAGEPVTGLAVEPAPRDDHADEQ